MNDTAPNGAPVPRSFNETLIWSQSDAALVFMAYLNPNQHGFNSSGTGSRYDFEMLVTEDGHLDDTSATTYYFFVELE